MPIYPVKNCIFVHIPKTAGGSIEALLKPYIVENRHDRLRRITSNFPFREDLSKVCIRGHDTAAWIRTKIGAALFEQFFTFTVVRNPYDRAISSYEFARQRPQLRRNKRALKQNFEEFLFARPALCQSQWITDKNGRLIVNEIARFESLHADLDSIFNRIGISERLDDERRNTSEKQQRDFYLTQEAISLINQHARQDFDLLGYEKLT